jgi:hypothetical protein
VRPASWLDARFLLAPCLAASVAGCSVGEGEGEVHSDRLLMGKCWDGEFDLNPTFFAAQPFNDTLRIRIQRGEQDIERADGLSLLVSNVANIRAERLTSPGDDPANPSNPRARLSVGLPPGVSPPGYPIREVPEFVDVSGALYLNNSCNPENANLFTIGGWVSFEKLFSGDPNENNADDRQTVGNFELLLIDPRQAEPLPAADETGVTYRFPEEFTSTLSGNFSFVFHRGTPAQPFP